MKKIAIITCACLVAFMANTLNVKAQDEEARDSKALRTHTWSVYVQGGASWATGLKFKSINPAAGTSVAPEVGLGVNYNLRPWVRLGLNYEFSKYKREQRLEDLEALDPSFNPYNPSYNGHASGFINKTNNSGTAYRQLWNMYHNVDLTAEFNIMELWPNRKCTKFNLYAGTGIGMMFARGNTYSISMGSEQWESPNNAVDNTDNWVSYTWLEASNSRHHYNALYMPVVLSVEYDVMPQLTLGVKGQYKAIFSSNDFAPDGLEAAAVVVRYNFVGARQGIVSCKELYKETLEKCNELRAEATQAREAEANSRNALNAANAENQKLKQQLKDCNAAVADCEEEKTAVAIAPATIKDLAIQFRNNSAKVSVDDRERLEALAHELKANEQVTISLLSEASLEGKTAKNQKLSERRLANVMSILKKNGISGDRIKTAKAIGEANRVPGPSHRRVEISVSK